MSVTIERRQKFFRLTREEERELHDRMRQGCERSRDKLARYGMGLMPAIIYKQTGRGIPIDELESLGNTALHKALEGFDPTKARFGQYLKQKMWSAVQDYLRSDAAMIRVPRQEIHRPESEHKNQVAWHVLSVDQLIGEGRGSGDSPQEVPDRAAGPSHEIERLDDANDLRRRYWQGMQALDEREREILLMRHSGIRQKQIGKEIGCSESRVSQMLASIIPRFEEAAGIAGHMESIDMEDATLPAGQTVSEPERPPSELLARIEAIKAAIKGQEYVLGILRGELLWLEGMQRVPINVKITSVAPTPAPARRKLTHHKRQRGMPRGHIVAGSLTWLIKNHLLEHGPSTSGELAQAIGKPKPSVAASLSAGKSCGHFERVGDFRWDVADAPG